jgi:hypothetical protein
MFVIVCLFVCLFRGFVICCQISHLFIFARNAKIYRSAQTELAETQTLLNENLNHVRKVARTIAKTDIAQLSMMYERELDLRVKLQDQLQSLKGNIRVFCRIRPLLGKEIEDVSLALLSFLITLLLALN